MKSKTPLALIEQTLMILVFSIAAAVCISAFVHADSVSENTKALSTAVFKAQAAAELFKAGEDDISLDDESGFSLSLSYKDSPHQNLIAAEITVCDEDGDILCVLPVYRQKEGGSP